MSAHPLCKDYHSKTNMPISIEIEVIPNVLSSKYPLLC